ncbi:MAG: hypothetical protein ABI321_01245 [Polyangia bacterium]
MRFGSALFFSLLLGTSAFAGEAPRRVVPKPIAVKGGLTQITGKGMRVGQKTFKRREPADPFVDLQPGGKVSLYGTGPQGRRGGGHAYLEFASLDSMLHGGKFETKMMKLDPRLDSVGAQPWDLMVHRWPDGKEVMYGAVMEPTGRRRSEPKWPDDNWTRRVYAFEKDAKGTWQIHGKPLFNEVTDKTKPTMIGHAYGHHFKAIERDTPNGKVKETWLFHEEVSREIDTPQGKRLVTELFARKMLDPFTASPDKVLILGAGNPPVFGQRANGDYLVEGPRPFEATVGNERMHFVTFSAADFANDRYDIHFAWRRGDGIGPYTPMTTNGELTRYADKLKDRYALSWVGRAHVIEKPDGSLYAVFHAVNKNIRPEVIYDGKQNDDLETFRRNVYVVPLKITPGKDGVPVIELVDDPHHETGEAALTVSKGE